MNIIDIRTTEPPQGAKGHVPPMQGFRWAFHAGDLLLHSSERPLDDWMALHRGDQSGFASGAHRFWNHIGGVVDLAARTLTIDKESFSEGLKSGYRSRGLHDLIELRAALAALEHLGVRGDFAFKGGPKGFPSRTVEQVARLPDGREVVFGGGPLVMFHGTSLERWRRIKEEGLVPGRVKRPYNDLVAGYSESKVYLAWAPWTAEFYARRQMRWDGDAGWVVLRVEVDDPSLIRADDEMLHRRGGGDWEERGLERWRIEMSLAEKGEVAHAGAIPAERVTPLRTFPAAAMRGPVPERAGAPVPRIFHVPAEAIPHDAEHLLPRHRRIDRDDALERILERTRGSRAERPRDRLAVMEAVIGWDDVQPEGTVAVLPPDEKLSGHDRSWLTVAREHLEAGNANGAEMAANAYWSGQPLAGEWEYLAPFARVLEPRPAPMPDGPSQAP